ncbi:hypothetical protein SVAN01_06754 [Stagonosporopsis vannaccii]|nr:hypothetical protein SVAN01_06754 [Stagonosporopsis vannaccii]
MTLKRCRNRDVSAQLDLEHALGDSSASSGAWANPPKTASGAGALATQVEQLGCCVEAVSLAEQRQVTVHAAMTKDWRELTTLTPGYRVKTQAEEP